jgi:VIT1/CCC1 family predicted Fe2+/Mn2+ transporter
MLTGAVRMFVWGAIAMAVTTYVGLVFGAAG